MRFTTAETEQLRAGLRPQAMEDKWYILLQGDWLNFHRSWTGILVFAVCLAPEPEGFHVAEAWVNRDPEQYKSTDAAYDTALLRFLIDALLLQKPDAVFPLPKGQAQAAPSVFQHHIVGQQFPVAPIEPSRPD
jgi:hypothetical protein